MDRSTGIAWAVCAGLIVLGAVWLAAPPPSAAAAACEYAGTKRMAARLAENLAKPGLADCPVQEQRAH
jgi:hypothetical protein